MRVGEHTRLAVNFEHHICRSGNIREVLISANFIGGQIREFKDLAKIIIILALLKKK